MIDPNLPSFELVPSRQAAHNASFYYIQPNLPTAVCKYHYHRADPQSPKSHGVFAAAVIDPSNPKIVYGEVLVKPEWPRPPGTNGSSTSPNGTTTTTTTTTPFQTDQPEHVTHHNPSKSKPQIPKSITLNLYSPDVLIPITFHPQSFSTPPSVYFTFPQFVFPEPSPSALDRDHVDPNIPTLIFAWRRSTTSLTPKWTCYYTGTDTLYIGGGGSGSSAPNAPGGVGRSKGVAAGVSKLLPSSSAKKDPDITLAYFEGLDKITLYEPNFARLEMDDVKGLEVTLLFTAALIRDLYMEKLKDPFHLQSAPAPAPTQGSGLASGAFAASAVNLGTFSTRDHARPPSHSFSRAETLPVKGSGAKASAEQKKKPPVSVSKNAPAHAHAAPAPLPPPRHPRVPELASSSAPTTHNLHPDQFRPETYRPRDGYYPSSTVVGTGSGAKGSDGHAQLKAQKSQVLQKQKQKKPEQKADSDQPIPVSHAPFSPASFLAINDPTAVPAVQGHQKGSPSAALMSKLKSASMIFDGSETQRRKSSAQPGLIPARTASHPPALSSSAPGPGPGPSGGGRGGHSSHSASHPPPPPPPFGSTIDDWKEQRRLAKEEKALRREYGDQAELWRQFQSGGGGGSGGRPTATATGAGASPVHRPGRAHCPRGGYSGHHHHYQHSRHHPGPRNPLSQTEDVVGDLVNRFRSTSLGQVNQTLRSKFHSVVNLRGEGGGGTGTGPGPGAGVVHGGCR